MISLVLGVSATIGGQTAPAQADTTVDGYGADVNPTGNPIGGGAGYSNIITSGDYTVTTKAELLAALSAATSGQVIYVPESASIDLSGQYSLVVKEGVTIASNRGQAGSLGGRIYFTTMTAHYKHLFAVRSHVTFNGIRLEGPDGSIGTSGADPLVDGICANGYHGLVVENCEIYNWPYAGICAWNDGLSGLSSADRGYIHHNYIHHCRRLGLGYGIEVSHASYLIEANIFDYSRHHICGGRGTPVTNYELRYNYFGANCTHTLVDCHGGNDLPADGFAGGPDASVPAGGTLSIHHNTFYSASQPSVKPRGIPSVICEVYRNWTYWTYSTPTSGAFKQELDHLPGHTPYENMSVYDNWYGTTPPPSTNQPPVLDAIGDRTVNETATLAFTISASDADSATMTYSASNLPQGATFDPATRNFLWTPVGGQSGVYPSVHFQVSDGESTDYEDITITVTVNNPLQADVNGDGAVNSLDMIRVGQHWNETGTGGWIREDINKDGTVNVLDATLVGQGWTG
jgi:hypothetical protein